MLLMFDKRSRTLFVADRETNACRLLSHAQKLCERMASLMEEDEEEGFSSSSGSERSVDEQRERRREERRKRGGEGRGGGEDAMTRR